MGDDVQQRTWIRVRRRELVKTLHDERRPRHRLVGGHRAAAAR